MVICRAVSKQLLHTFTSSRLHAATLCSAPETCASRFRFVIPIRWAAS